MTVTMNMLADALTAEGIVFAQRKFPPDKRTFDHIFALKNSSGSDVSSMIRGALESSETTLFVGNTESCSTVYDVNSDALCIAVEDDRIDDTCLIASTLIANQLRWQLKIAKLNSEDATFQDVIDASECLTGNPLILSDAAFGIVAYSRNAIPDVPFVKEAIERGAFDNKTMQLFRKRRRPALWDKARDKTSELHYEDTLIPRPQYMEWLERWKDKPVIKIVTGLHRCGKSSVLKLFQEHLRLNGIDDSNIPVYIIPFILNIK